MGAAWGGVLWGELHEEEEYLMQSCSWLDG